MPLRKLQKLKSDWAAPCFGLATALHVLGQEDAAITAYRSALALESNHGEAHFELALLLQKEGPRQRCRRALQRGFLAPSELAGTPPLSGSTA